LYIRVYSKFKHIKSHGTSTIEKASPSFSVINFGATASGIYTVPNVSEIDGKITNPDN